jgi:hypothetical protein
MHPRRIRKAAIALKPATLTKFRSTLLSRNYHRLFSSRKNAKPGPKGPSDDLVRVIVEMKQRNTQFGCPRIAQQINKAFGVNIDKDVVRRVLAKHYRPKPYNGGLSWLTFFRHTRDSLWSIVLFGRASILPRYHSILLAIDQFIRRIINRLWHLRLSFRSKGGSLYEVAIPVVDASKSLSPDPDPHFSHHRCRRKLLCVGRTQTVPVFPRAPPFAERRIGTRRRIHHEYRSNCSAIDLEIEHEALNNNHNIFPMSGALDEFISSQINIDTSIDHAEAQKSSRKRHNREKLRTLIAA